MPENSYPNHRNSRVRYEGICMNPYCNANGLWCRGLCRSCYDIACNYIADDRPSWKELIRQGRALPQRDKKRKEGSRFRSNDIKAVWFIESFRKINEHSIEYLAIPAAMKMINPFKLKIATVRHRLDNGWSMLKALTTELLRGGRPKKR